MQIWPAIDLRGGKCVRLEQGDYHRETIFGDDPAAMALHWTQAGARFLHLVDLDGARDGLGVNRSAVATILNAVDVPCELGGGIRDEATIRYWLELGIQRVVVGTKALKEPDWFCHMCDLFPGELALGLDARNGFVATDGWLETSQVQAVDFARRFSEVDMSAIIYTDISRDGMLSGPNFDGIAALMEAVSVPVVASGGVTTSDDVRRLAEMGVPACILGRTLYEGKLTIAEALSAAGT
jgi:phosphoribosylformimino-5-aminoimidazole carboxamide ribotide isomerase